MYTIKNIANSFLNVKWIEPPIEIIEFLKTFGDIDIAFADDNNVDRSYRYLSSIIINTRGTTWDAMITFPWGLRDYGEDLLMRILHELGHIVRNHLDGIQLNDAGNVKSVNNFYDSLRGKEGEAREFAFWYRHNKKEQYKQLSNICFTWANSYEFANKNWENTTIRQWKIVHKNNLADSIFELPIDIYERFKPYVFNYGTLNLSMI